MYLFLDDEMGGLEKEKYSLLSTYFMVTDDDFNIIGELSLFLKPDDGIYHVCADAMDVNKINLIEHNKIAVTYKEGATILYNWLKKISDNGKLKLTPVGHGIYGDVDWITYYLISQGSWETFVSYRKLDTQAIFQFFKACNKIDDDVSGSLLSIAKYYKIPLDENEIHNAKYDTQLTYKVFMALRNDEMTIPVAVG